MKTLQDFQSSKNSLLEKYSLLLKSNILPVQDITAEAIKQRQSKLKEEAFTIAVCGQIKSGKSTLLNALFFGDAVLPYDDTPLTAKITFIKHGNDIGVTIQFYSKSEWDSVKRDYSSNTTLEADFMQGIENSIRHGAYEDEYIRKTAMTKQVAFAELGDYVAAPQPGRSQGRFTPFVKSIHITANIPWLRDVTVVDTPGINDPCRINSETTEKWINQADAVIYVAYAGRPLDKIDVDFINTMLTGVSPSHRIIAINKCDLFESTDKQDIMDWAARLSQSDVPCLRNVFSQHGSFHYVSALGSLIAAMSKKGLPLGELEFHHEDLSEGNFLSDDGNAVNGLSESITLKLLQNKGNGIIESNTAFIQGVFRKAERAIQLHLESLNEEYSAHSMSYEELEQSKNKVLQQRAKTKSFTEDLSTRWTSMQDKVKTNIHNDLIVIKKNMNTDISKTLKNSIQIYKTKAVIQHMTWIAKDTIENNSSDFQKASQKAAEDLTDFINELKAEMEGFVVQDFGGSVKLTSSLVVIPVSEILEEIERIPNSMLEESKIKDVILQNRGLWEKLRGKAKEGSFVNSKIENELRKCIDKTCEVFRESIIEDKLRPITRNFENNFESELNQILQQRQKTFEVLLKDEKNLDKRKAAIEKSIQDTSVQEEKLRTLKEKVLS